MKRVLAATTLLLAACAGGQPDLATLTSNSDQVIWEAGQKALERRQWDNARQHFRRIVEGFPQSRYGVDARLALADTHVREGGQASDILAIGVYRDFLTVYPSHPKADFAQFQVAEAYFRQRNSPDRDQTDTLRALEEYHRLLEIYPNTQYAEQARERIAETRYSLARAEFLAGYFYQRTREACRSAIPRYEGILKDYPDYRDLDEVLYRLGECLGQSGRTAEALPQLGRLVEDYPQSRYVASARALMDSLAAQPAPSPAPEPPPMPEAPPPGPAPSPSPQPRP